MVDPPLYKFTHLMPAEVMDHIPTDAAGAADLFFLLSSLLLITFAGARRPSHLCLFPFLSLTHLFLTLVFLISLPSSPSDELFSDAQQHSWRRCSVSVPELAPGGSNV